MSDKICRAAENIAAPHPAALRAGRRWEEGSGAALGQVPWGGDRRSHPAVWICVLLLQGFLRLEGTEKEVKGERWLIYSLPSSLILIALFLGSLSYPDMEMGGGGSVSEIAELWVFAVSWRSFDVPFALKHFQCEVFQPPAAPQLSTSGHDPSRATQTIPSKLRPPHLRGREAICPCRTQHSSWGNSGQDHGLLQACSWLVVGGQCQPCVQLWSNGAQQNCIKQNEKHLSG